MPATHHSSAPLTPTTGTPPAHPTDTPVPPPPRGAPSPAPETPPQKPSVTTTAPPAPVTQPPPPSVAEGTAVGRIPVLDVRPLVTNGRRPAKAVVGETFEVSATVFREGHDAVAANVVLRDPEGRPGRWTPM
ncbi:maltotransferase domain-containing protein, partial [Streptomyces sp. ADMS]|uniref:maltotransferase domain-containing protein n=1 Tax=Streptomyces sp. ADMS TaxID=3071415 RepID=UPI00296E9FBF